LDYFWLIGTLFGINIVADFYFEHAAC